MPANTQFQQGVGYLLLGYLVTYLPHAAATIATKQQGKKHLEGDFALQFQYLIFFQA